LSRPLVVLALVLFAAASIAPLAAMAPRIAVADLALLAGPRVWDLLGRTTVLGLTVAALAFALGLPFGLLVARTDLPGAGWLRSLGVVPLLLPTLFLAMTWTVFTTWRGFGAAAWVLGLSTFPLVAIFAARAAERVDGRLEDAARLAGGWSAALRVTLALTLPPALAGACLSFVFAVNDFAVPDYVSSVGPKFNVYADEIFASWGQVGSPGRAVALALPLLALNLLALVPALALRKRGALASLGSGFRSPDVVPLGPWRWPAFALALALLTVAALAPLGRLLWEAARGPAVWSDGNVAAVLARPAEEVVAGVGARERLAAAPRLLAAQAEHLAGAFRLAFDRSRADLLASLRHALIAATAAALAGLVLGHGIERARRRWAGKGLELLALLPLAAPATLFGIGAIVLWARPGTQELYQGPAMPPLLFAGRLLTFAVLILSGAVASLDRSLEDAAAVAGARPARRLAWIVAPNLRGALAGAWALVFAFSMRELDAAILVPAANRTAIVRVFNGVHFGRDDFVAALALLLVLVILLPGMLWTAFARRRLEVLP
jgi:iron(III) transport system permease protein